MSNNSSMPQVSVLLPVYNGERYLSEAIESILKQTFADFELIIIDDGSTDHTPEIIESFNDKRIQVIRQSPNRGLAKTLNHGLSASSGELIARIDADDRSLPERIAKQVSFLEENREVDVLGTMAIRIDAVGKKKEGTLPRRHMSSHEIKWALLWTNPIAHPTVMFRREAIERIGGYPGFRYAQDLALWMSLRESSMMAILNEGLVEYREHDEKISIQKLEQQNAVACDVVREQITRYAGYEPASRVIAIARHLQILPLPGLDETALAVKLIEDSLKGYLETEKLQDNDRKMIAFAAAEWIAQILEAFPTKRSYLLKKTIRLRKIAPRISETSVWKRNIARSLLPVPLVNSLLAAKSGVKQGFRR